MAEEFLDAYRNPLREGIYANRNSHGYFKVKKKGDRFVLVDSAVPNVEYAPAGHITCQLRPVENLRSEIEGLRKSLGWLEEQMKEENHQKAAPEPENTDRYDTEGMTDHHGREVP